MGKQYVLTLAPNISKPVLSEIAIQTTVTDKNRVQFCIGETQNPAVQPCFRIIKAEWPLFSVYAWSHPLALSLDKLWWGAALANGGCPGSYMTCCLLYDKGPISSTSGLFAKWSEINTSHYRFLLCVPPFWPSFCHSLGFRCPLLSPIK